MLDRILWGFIMVLLYIAGILCLILFIGMIGSFMVFFFKEVIIPYFNL